MADWTNLPNAAVGVGGLPSGTTVTALRDNPVAIAQGAAGAPRLYLRALEQLEAGNQIRSRNDTLTSASQGAVQTLLSFNFIQTGSIRATARKVESSGTLRLVRIRNGASTTLLDTSSTAAQNLDVDVLPGDTLLWSLVADFSSDITSAENARFMTNGQDLWPGSGLRLEGNRAAT